MMIKTHVINNIPTGAELIKQVKFGTAVGLTKLAKAGQKAVVRTLPMEFNTRGRWFEQGNKFGIRITPAKPAKLESAVHTQADWLGKQKEGGRIPGSKNVRTFHYTYRGVRYIAIPSRELRPKGSKKVISRSLWPSSLRKKKSTFVIQSRRTKTPIVMSRFAPGKSGYVAMYILRPAITILKKDAFERPIRAELGKIWRRTFEQEITKALRTAK